VNICKTFLSSGGKNVLEKEMIKCNLSRLMGEQKLKISELSRDTGINRGTLTRLYQETAERVELDVLDKLCIYLNCEIGDLLQHIDDQ
jgi:putative transcriptional regulator